MGYFFVIVYKSKIRTSNSIYLSKATENSNAMNEESETNRGLLITDVVSLANYECNFCHQMIVLTEISEHMKLCEINSKMNKKIEKAKIKNTDQIDNTNKNEIKKGNSKITKKNEKARIEPSGQIDDTERNINKGNLQMNKKNELWLR